jgi:hypothetical protein
MRVTPIVFGALIMVVSLACGPSDWSIDTSGKLTVALTHKQSSDEMIVLRLKVAPLPDGATIDVFTLDKTLVGGVAPYGVRPGSKARYYSIPIPASAVVEKKVSVRLEVVEKSTQRKRPPARTEIEGATLAYTPIARQPGQKNDDSK